MQKRMLLFVPAILACLFTLSCSTSSSDYATIRGSLEGDWDGYELQLKKVKHGKLETVAVSHPGADNSFGFTLVPEPGIYVVNTIHSESERSHLKDHSLVRFYLEKGNELDIVIRDGSYELLSSNSVKNDLLSGWNTLADSLYTYSAGFAYNVLSYEDFFPVLPDFVSEARTYAESLDSGDPEFDEFLRLMIETELSYAALGFIYTPRTRHPERAIYPEFYDELLHRGKPVSETLLELPFGINYMRLYTMLSLASQPEEISPQERPMAVLDQIGNDLLKGYYALEDLKRYRSYDARYLEYRAFIEAYMLNDHLKASLKQHELAIRSLEQGELAIDFSGKDLDGKQYKLSDFKGSLVYVDVWATWCGPCKKEIPHLKQLEADFHDKDIVFLSISVDPTEKRKEWEDFVAREDLKGMQLMAENAFDSQLVRSYKITGIPRFMLFDREGRIISTDAPRPSSPSIRELLKENLK